MIDCGKVCNLEIERVYINGETVVRLVVSCGDGEGGMLMMKLYSDRSLLVFEGTSVIVC